MIECILYPLVGFAAGYFARAWYDRRAAHHLACERAVCQMSEYLEAVKEAKK